jgi:hypothetical protein
MAYGRAINISHLFELNILYRLYYRRMDQLCQRNFLSQLILSLSLSILERDLHFTKLRLRRFAQISFILAFLITASNFSARNSGDCAEPFQLDSKQL